MQTSLLAIAKKAQEKKDLRFFNLYRLIDENLLLAGAISARTPPMGWTESARGSTQRT